MARCGCGGACSCALVAGNNTTVTGSGTPANPWKVNAVTNCDEVRDCLSANQGAAYDPNTGVISVCVSPNAGNSLTRDANGCLFVSPGNNAVVSGCGISGTGTAASPLAIEGKAWPFACDQDSATAMGVYCDPDTGQVHGDPPFRMDVFQEAINVVEPGANGIAVSTAAEVTYRTLTLDVTNPDPCRPAQIMYWRDVDADLDLPPNSGAMIGFDGDDMSYLGNEGSGTIFSTHAQTGKMSLLTLAAGATTTLTMQVNNGRGSGGARIRRTQATMRAFVFSLP
jgi:hypothetical protein